MPEYRDVIVDVDIHHRPRSTQEWVPYLSDEWKRTVDGQEVPFLPIPLWVNAAGGSQPNGARRTDLEIEPGLIAGYDIDLVKRELLDPFNHWRGILTHDLGEHAGGSNPYFTADVCRAANEWTLDTWLSADERLYGLITVPTTWPEAAAAEIRRLGAHEKFAGVLLSNNGLGVPFGHPVFHPIYEAAAEMGLGILFHPCGGDVVHEAAGGYNGLTAEYITQAGQRAMHIISSLIVHGVFEKHPGLKVVLTEYGWTWLPNLLWRLDGQYKLLSQESPWVKRLPSEYVREHVRLGTQPMEESIVPGGIRTLVESVEGIEDVLCFSSDFPHWTQDEPWYLAREIPEEWHRKVFCENAAEVFGFGTPPTLVAGGAGEAVDGSV
jgi:predicted TIM-barrel fold metal-dependent hydrolase